MANKVYGNLPSRNSATSAKADLLTKKTIPPIDAILPGVALRRVSGIYVELLQLFGNELSSYRAKLNAQMESNAYCRSIFPTIGIEWKSLGLPESILETFKAMIAAVIGRQEFD